MRAAGVESLLRQTRSPSSAFGKSAVRCQDFCARSRSETSRNRTPARRGNSDRLAGIQFTAGPLATSARFRVIYYVSPQVWAWRSYRAHSIRRDVDLLLSILPFEKDWYAGRGMTHVEYVGHPLVGK